MGWETETRKLTFSIVRKISLLIYFYRQCYFFVSSFSSSISAQGFDSPLTSSEASVFSFRRWGNLNGAMKKNAMPMKTSEMKPTILSGKPTGA